MTSSLLKNFLKIGPQTHNKSPIQESTAEIHTLIIYLHVSPVIWDPDPPLILLFDDKSSRPICLTRPKVQGFPVFVFRSLRRLAAGGRVLASSMKMPHVRDCAISVLLFKDTYT